jgi:hypothetical protein
MPLLLEGSGTAPLFGLLNKKAKINVNLVNGRAQNSGDY